MDPRLPENARLDRIRKIGSGPERENVPSHPRAGPAPQGVQSESAEARRGRRLVNFIDLDLEVLKFFKAK